MVLYWMDIHVHRQIEKHIDGEGKVSCDAQVTPNKLECSKTLRWAKLQLKFNSIPLPSQFLPSNVGDHKNRFGINLSSDWHWDETSSN